MKIELKNTDFKFLYEWLNNHREELCIDVNSILDESLKPQYEEAFLKYKDENQKFNIGDKVKFGKENKSGVIKSVQRLSNGKFRYGIEYSYVGDYNEANETILFSAVKYLTEKKLKKIE